MITGPFYTYISPAEMLRFVIFVYNYPGGPRVSAAAAWPCTNLIVFYNSQTKAGFVKVTL